MNTDLFGPLKELVRQRAKQNGKPFLVGMIIGAGDFHTLVALKEATEEGWLKLALYGKEDIFNAVLIDSGLSRSNCVLVDAIDRENRVIAVTEAAKGGGLAAICIGPDAVTRNFSLFRKEREDFFPHNDPGCGISVLAMPDFDRLLFVADTLATAQPSIKERVVIVQHVIQAVKKCGVAHPNVALLAAVEVVDPSMPVTVQAQQIAEKVVAEDAYVEGPISMDLAVNPEAVKRKKASGMVPGNADCLIGPNLTVSRSVYQAAITLCGACAGTVMVGGKVPVAMPGRIESEEGMLLSTLLAVAMAD